jgi:hypothetical protein
MQGDSTVPIEYFQFEMTVRWSCRRGDHVFWLSWKSILVDPEVGVTVRDYWEMKDGDFLTITNRLEDMPPWFALHPTEVCNRLAYQLSEKVRRGEYPEEPIEAPNIWRPKAGDRLVWTRQPRAGFRSQDPIVSAMAFRESALVIGENVRVPSSFDELMSFGALTGSEQREVPMIRAAVHLVRRMGLPSEYDLEWKVG